MLPTDGSRLTHSSSSPELRGDHGLRISAKHQPRRLSEQISRIEEAIAQFRGVTQSDPDLEVTIEDLDSYRHSKSDDSGSDTSDEEEEEDIDPSQRGGPAKVPKVTFRPRVRITSGLNRARSSAFYSAPSTRSCSPSSSISAPIRFHSEETAGRPGWGTLGERVTVLARRSEHKRRFRERAKRHERMLKQFQGDYSITRGRRGSETSPLLARPITPSEYICQCGVMGCQFDERRIAQEIDAMFGTWPGRMLNPKVSRLSVVALC